LDLADAISRSKLSPVKILFFGYFARSLRQVAGTVGGAGMIDKTTRAEDLRAAILAVAAGEAIPEGLLKRRGAESTVGPRPPSPREVEIMTLMADGASVDQVARTLGVGDRTIETHMTRMYERYNAANRSHLLVFADRHGWLRRPS
jgi:DNA-binding NarL/FixJ family response regulator